MKKTVFILRGVPGSGKSTFADYIQSPKVVCCADDYHYDVEGNYNWKPENGGKAHKYCQDTFDKAMDNPKIKNIIIANTNIKSSDYKYYVDRANVDGSMVVFLVLENRHGGVNQHNVPEETLQRMESTLRENIKLR